MPSLPLPYTRRLLPDQPAIDDIRAAATDYAAILISVITHVADRYEHSPYRGLVDTKFSIVTGEEFAKDDLRGPKTVYGWIQGRGLEALVGHAQWIEAHPWSDPNQTLLPRLRTMIHEVYGQLRQMRERNQGRLFFFMDPEGAPFVFSQTAERVPHPIEPNHPYNFSDLFGSRGLFAAATYIGDDQGIQDASAYCLAVEQALWEQNFQSDQQRLPPFTAPQATSERPRFTHAPFTIQLATPAMMAEHWHDRSYAERGLRLMEHVMKKHLNTGGRQPALRPYDFWEFVDSDGKPLTEDRYVLSDPGHSLEFVGLGLKLTRAAKRIGVSGDQLVPFEDPMHGLLQRSFENGYVARTGGIYKGIDLISRAPIDPTMPWWSLPETMRAAIGCWAIGDTEQRDRALAIFAACHNSFLSHYVLPERHLFAVQTRHGKTGEVVDVIPATADADPGYHTGLSLIDVLDVLEEETGPLEAPKA